MIKSIGTQTMNLRVWMCEQVYDKDIDKVNKPFLPVASGMSFL